MLRLISVGTRKVGALVGVEIKIFPAYPK
jgi:hypothetical protein